MPMTSNEGERRAPQSSLDRKHIQEHEGIGTWWREADGPDRALMAGRIVVWACGWFSFYWHLFRQDGEIGLAGLGIMIAFVAQGSVMRELRQALLAKDYEVCEPEE